MNLIKLPEDILEVIMCYSDNQIVAQFCLTNTKFKNIIEKCIQGGKINNYEIKKCFICNKNSITSFPILYSIWPRIEEDIITKYICSNKCRKSCLKTKEPVFGIAFYFL
jgi:hypothetical protein